VDIKTRFSNNFAGFSSSELWLMSLVFGSKPLNIGSNFGSNCGNRTPAHFCHRRVDSRRAGTECCLTKGKNLKGAGL
jgi:hypothetical protein